MAERTPALWAVIPAAVRYDKELRPNAKLLYGEISALATREGYCWASNAYFGDLFDLAPKTVAQLIGQLERKGYVRVEIVRDEATNEVVQRRIWADVFTVTQVCTPPLKNKGRSPQKCGDPPPKTGGRNNINNNITPYNPPEGGCADEMEERFERFWAAYPRKTNRQKARQRFMRIKPSEELLACILADLKRRTDSGEWAEVEYIPHASTYLNGRRWEDEPLKKTQGGADPPVTAARRWAGTRIDPETGEEVDVYA